VRKFKARAFALLNRGIDKLQTTFPPNRVVLLLAAPIGVAAGAVNAWVAVKFPGLPRFSDGQVTAFAITGFVSIVTLAYKYVDGWQKAEHDERVR
jgi:hypothetical protein